MLAMETAIVQTVQMKINYFVQFKTSIMRRPFFLAFFCFLLTLSSFGQNRSFVKDKIREWDECKNVAITMSGGSVVLKGKNSWAASGAPKAMTDRLTVLNERNVLIDDIVLTENGKWLILWGNNGIHSYGCPLSLDKKIRQWNSDKEVIYSISFNDKGQWIMISKNKVAASSSDILEWIQQGESEYGKVWAAHITNTGRAVVYSNGYKFMGEVPNNLLDKLKSTNLNVFRLKFLQDGSYFISDLEGKFQCYF
jgi:hypothetical protein